MNLKQYLSWGLAGLVGVGIALWQSNWFEGESSPDVTAPHQEQNRASLPLPAKHPSAEKSKQATVVSPEEKDTVKERKDSSVLLQQALAAANRLTPPGGGDQASAEGPDQGMPSAEEIAAYETEKARAEQEGLQYLLELLNSSKGDAKAEVITALWRYAAKIGVPEEVLAALDLASRDADPAVAKEATRALADLRRFKDRLENGPSPEELALQPPQPPASPDHTGASIGKNVTVDDAEYQARLAEYETAMQQREVDDVQTLNEKLRTAKDNEAYNEALHGLSLHRSDASVDAWLALTNDANFDVRYEAVQNLWRSAASGLDQDGRITTALQGAAGDGDKDVALLAQQALADLENFKRRQAQAAAAPPVVQSTPAGENGGDVSGMSGTVP